MSFSPTGFVQFLREQGVMGLAIGFTLGASANELVKSLVENIIDPTVGLFWKDQISLDTIMVGTIQIGAFISALIDFIIIAAVVYFVFKGFKLDALDLKKKNS